MIYEPQTTEAEESRLTQSGRRLHGDVNSFWHSFSSNGCVYSLFHLRHEKEKQEKMWKEEASGTDNTHSRRPRDSIRRDLWRSFKRGASNRHASELTANITEVCLISYWNQIRRNVACNRRQVRVGPPPADVQTVFFLLFSRRRERESWRAAACLKLPFAVIIRSGNLALQFKGISAALFSFVAMITYLQRSTQSEIKWTRYGGFPISHDPFSLFCFSFPPSLLLFFLERRRTHSTYIQQTTSSPYLWMAFGKVAGAGGGLNLPSFMTSWPRGACVWTERERGGPTGEEEERKKKKNCLRFLSNKYWQVHQSENWEMLQLFSLFTAHFAVVLTETK